MNGPTALDTPAADDARADVAAAISRARAALAVVEEETTVLADYGVPDVGRIDDGREATEHALELAAWRARLDGLIR